MLPEPCQLESQVQSPSNRRPRCSQVRDPIGTSKSANISNTFQLSYHLIFFLKAKIHMDTPARESDNIPYRGTYIVLRDSGSFIKHQLENLG